MPVGVTRSGCSASRVSFTPGCSVWICGGSSFGTSGAFGGAAGGALSAERAGRRLRMRERFMSEVIITFSVSHLHRPDATVLLGCSLKQHSSAFLRQGGEPVLSDFAQSRVGGIVVGNLLIGGKRVTPALCGLKGFGVP